MKFLFYLNLVLIVVNTLFFVVNLQNNNFPVAALNALGAIFSAYSALSISGVK